MKPTLEIMLRTSGLAEKFKCDMQELIEVHGIWCKMMYSQETRERIGYESSAEHMQDYIKEMHMMRGDIRSVRAIYERVAKENEDYQLEIQVKKSAGTFNKWLEEITMSKEEEEAMDGLINMLSRAVKPIKHSNSLN